VPLTGEADLLRGAAGGNIDLECEEDDVGDGGRTGYCSESMRLIDTDAVKKVVGIVQP